MKKLLILSAASITIALAAPTIASASDDYCGQTNGTWIGIDVVMTKMTEKGYQVRKIERDDNCYEVKAFTKTGQRVEIYLNPSNGEIVRIKNKY